MAKTTGSDLLIRALQVEGVDTVFGIAGDHIPVSYTHLTLPTNREV